MEVTTLSKTFGALVTGVNLGEPVSEATLRQIRKVWIENKVVGFPDQNLSNSKLEEVVKLFGSVGEDPFFESMSDDTKVVAVTRRHDEKAPVFAENWHSDWSFMDEPPIGTCLYGVTIPPIGGKTSFINQELAYERMPEKLKQKIENLQVWHSAAVSYAPDGVFGHREQEKDRSMKIVASESARAKRKHPLVLRHPETGRKNLFGCIGYIIGVDGMGAKKIQSPCSWRFIIGKRVRNFNWILDGSLACWLFGIIDRFFTKPMEDTRGITANYVALLLREILETSFRPRHLFDLVMDFNPIVTLIVLSNLCSGCRRRFSFILFFD